MSTDWSSNATLADDTGDYVDVASNLDKYSDISNDQTNNAIDWYFPAIDLCEVNQWLLFENDISSNELSVSDICYIIKNKLLCVFQTEIFLQHPFIVQKLIRWLNENNETDLVLECLNLLVDKVVKRHYETITGLCENFENTDQDIGCSNSEIISMTNSDATNSDEFSRWGIARFCVSLMPTVLKHINCNSNGAFSLFMSSINLLSSIADNCNIQFYMELVFSNYSVKNILLNNPLSSLKLLIIAKELSALCGLINEPFKEIILNILKKAYWIHLYPALYHQLYAKFSNEELLELKIIKMVENAYTLSTNCNLDLDQYTKLLNNSLPIIWFHQKFSIIDTFIVETCKRAKLMDTKNDYGVILLNLLSFKSENVVLHTYLALNKIVKKLLDSYSLEPKCVDKLIKKLLCTNVLNEILCSGCTHSNEQVKQLASEIMERLLKSKTTITNDLWDCFLNSLVPIFPVLYCYSDQSSPFGQTVFNLFDPDHAENFNISKLMLLQSMVLMMMSKDKKSRIEANYRITWLLQTTLNKNIDLPNDIFFTEYENLNEKLEEPVGEYTENDLNDMIDLISSEFSSHQTIKCALYKISVMVEHNHLLQYFIQNGGMSIILNLLKSSKLFVNERGLLIALLKLILCFTTKNNYKLKDNLLANNFEIQLHLISVLSDFYEIPLVKQYISQIFVYSIFDQYLTHFGGKIPKIVADKILYSQIEIKKYWNPSNNHHNDILFSSIKNNKNCMDVLIVTWHLKQFDSIDSFLENGFPSNAHNYSFNDLFHNFRKASIKWSIKTYLINLSSAKSHSAALTILGDLKSSVEVLNHYPTAEGAKEFQ